MEAVKFVKGSDSIIEGWGMPFGGPFDGRDFDGEFFSPNTDFLLDWFKGERPLLYQHTRDPHVSVKSVGSVISVEKRDLGMWTRAQLDLRSAYLDALKQLVGEEALSFSSGAYPQGVQIAKSGEILRWPFVELSLTPTPSNPYASLSAMKFVTPPPVEVGVTVTTSTTTKPLSPEEEQNLAIVRRYVLTGARR